MKQKRKIMPLTAPCFRVTAPVPTSMGPSEIAMELAMEDYCRSRHLMCIWPAPFLVAHCAGAARVGSARIVGMDGDKQGTLAPVTYSKAREERK